MNYARNSSSRRNRPVDHILTPDSRATGVGWVALRVGRMGCDEWWCWRAECVGSRVVEAAIGRANPWGESRSVWRMRGESWGVRWKRGVPQGVRWVRARWVATVVCKLRG